MAQSKAQTTTTTVAAVKPATPAASSTTSFMPTYSVSSASTAVGGGSPAVGYPSFNQSSYASAANAYYKQMKDNKTNTTGQVGVRRDSVCNWQWNYSGTSE